MVSTLFRLIEPSESRFLDPAAAIVGAILGAVVGGWATYLATKATEANRRKELVLHLYSLLLLEVFSHQQSLFLEVDEFLPAWLLRGHEWLTGNGAETTPNLQFLWVKFRLFHLADDYLNRFLAELIGAELVVELEAYYRRVRSHNRMVDQWNSRTQDADEEIRRAQDYMKNSLELFKSSGKVLGKLRETPGITKFFSAEHKRALEFSDVHAHDFEYLVTLSELNIEHLRLLEDAKRFQAMDRSEYQAAIDMGASPPDTSGIPESIRNQSGFQWQNYLNRADKIIQKGRGGRAVH